MLHFPGPSLAQGSQTTPSKVNTGVLGDLGKPTMRGIRKCPKCGTYNGTRGLSCKNKTCDMVFKEAEGRSKRAGCDAVRLYTGTTTSIFSVRLRDKGPDYRGFVQLPTVEGLTIGDSLEGEAALLVQSASQCFVESCVRAGQGGGGEGGAFTCTHIAACLAQGVGEATPVMLRHSAMNDLNIRPEIKHEVYSRAEQIAGPLVQRVSKHVFCVKCEADQRHPLGYLHMCFMDQRTKDGPGVEHRFFCTCSTFRGLEMTNSPLFPQWTAMDREREPDWVLRRCVHFYSCLCAFASDAKLSEEFRIYIVMDQEIASRAADQSSLQENQVIAILGQDENGDTVQVEVLNQAELRGVLGEHKDSILYSDNKDMEGLVTITDDIQIEMETPDGNVQTITVPASSLSEAGSISTVSSSRVQLSGNTRKRQHSGRGGIGTPAKKSNSVSVASRLAGNQDSVDEVNVSLSFHEWLGSVTERINQTMHYQFDGHPEPLVFHAPQVFFDCLRERISMGSRKKRLPNSTTAFVRKDALPLGTFTKYTWSINNVLHVKQIFDTPHIQLEVTKTFVENKDGSFSVHISPDAEDDQFHRLPGKRIKAHELKTFLKVGQTLPDQKDLTPFVIEWIPDILPFMKIGELRIKFEYGHQRNGQLEQRITVPVHIPDGLYSM